MEVYSEMRAFGVQMLKDIALIAENKPAVLWQIARIAESGKFEVEIEVPRDFRVLYPIEDLENHEESTQRQVQDVFELAASWSKEPPQAIIEYLVQVEKQAREAGLNYPCLTSNLCHRIADLVNDPDVWLREILTTNLGNDVAFPFLHKVVHEQIDDWEELSLKCIERPEYRASIVETVLTHKNPPKRLLNIVLDNLDGFEDSVRVYCIRQQICDEVLLLLLRHRNTRIAGYVLWAEWYIEPKGTVRDFLRADWEQVLLHSFSDNYELSEIFKREHALAFQWLLARLDDPSFVGYEYDRAIKAATEYLSVEDRKLVLSRFTSDQNLFRLKEVVLSVVDNNIEAYRYLLGKEILSDLHLAPLGGEIDAAWIEFALLAHDAGYNSGEIAAATYLPTGVSTWSGNVSDMWLKWVKQFEPLCNHENEHIRQIAIAGRDTCETNRQAALKRERYEAIYGRR